MKTLDGILIMLLISLLFVMFLGIRYIKQDGAKCLKAPVNYGLLKLEEHYKAPISCYCNNDLFINSSVIIKKINPYAVPNKYNLTIRG